jgi:exopolyphosphatase/guanosine-5'-triphosphate,3'-diphosphate pyrophosphatase
LTEALIRSDPPRFEEVLALREQAREVRAAGALERAAREGAGAGDVVAVAGTATTLAALDQALPVYDRDRVEGYWVDRDRLEEWIDRLAAQSVEERRALPGMEPGRADVILAGAVVLSEILRGLGAQGFGVSGRGVRYGVALRVLEQPGAVW